MRTASISRYLVPLSLIGWAVLENTLHAQPSPPRINAVQPIGGQKGTNLELTVAGQFLDNAETLHFSFPGVKVEAGASGKVDIKPDPKAKGGMKGPATLTVQKFKVTLPADAPLGIHDVCLVTKAGISNPRAFVVSDTMEIVEKESNDDVGQAQKIELNTSVSGVVATPTDVDYYSFTGKKGQRIVVSCLSTSVDSKLPVQLQLYSSGGSYLGLGRAYWNNDALLDATLPADGEYHVRLCSFTYTQGGPDYFYRLSVSTAPWIDAVQPMAIEPGKETKVAVWGRNLPGGAPDASAVVDGRVLEKAIINVKAPNDPKKLNRLEYSGTVLPLSAGVDGMELRIKNDAGFSNPFLLTYARSPVVDEQGENDTAETARKINLPSEVSGRLEKKGDRDWYAFSLKKGETIRIEVLGDRLGAPHDLYFQLRDEKDKTITEQDENTETTSNLFFTRNEDPAVYRFTAPGDGVYTLMVTSREAFSSFGPRYHYLARIGKEEPDFRLVAMPASILPDGATLRQGGNQAWNVFVLRDGYNGEITLSAESLLAGLSMTPQKIGAGQKAGAFVISVAAEAPPSLGTLKIVGTANVGGKKLVREARAASITWPGPPGVNNAVLISRLNRELAYALRGQAPFTIAAEKTSISASVGEKISIPIKFTPIAPDFKTQIQVTALNAPTGLVSQPLVVAADKKNGTLSLDSKTPATPGMYTLVLRGQTAPPGKGPAPKGPLPANVVEYSSPVTLIIIPKQVAKIVVEKTPKLMPGKSVELVVRVDRLFDFPGEFKIEVVSAKKEVTASNATIKEGSNEVIVPLKVSQDIKAGTNVTLTVRATAMFHGTPIVQELKGVNIPVTK